MTHLYTLLLGGTVLAPSAEEPVCEAIAWAEGTILAFGSEADVRALSRGDSHVLRADGSFVVGDAGPLEIGGPADLIVYRSDPRQGRPGSPAARVRAGRIVEGHLARE